MSLRICDSGTEHSYRSRRRCMCFRVVYKPIIICSEICARCLSIGNGQGAYIMVSNMTMSIDWFGDAPKTSRDGDTGVRPDSRNTNMCRINTEIPQVNEGSFLVVNATANILPVEQRCIEFGRGY
ncbi:GATA transcription factor AreB [Fusarium oxysporum f. sp. albedinis]|nr:GATA transcription factor AreB [Fusarium oxysporum f. sp. albedinis]